MDPVSKPAQDRRDEPINIRLRGEYGLLSNLAETPFELDGVEYASVEAFIQAIKIPETDPKREQVVSMSGVAAKFAANDENQAVERSLKEGGIASVYYQGQAIEYRSVEHLELIESAIRAKFEQNADLRDLLVATGDTELTHQPSKKAESPYTSLPAKAFCMILTNLRFEYQSQDTNIAESELELSQFSFTD